MDLMFCYTANIFFWIRAKKLELEQHSKCTLVLKCHDCFKSEGYIKEGVSKQKDFANGLFYNNVSSYIFPLSFLLRDEAHPDQIMAAIKCNLGLKVLHR